MENTEFCKHQDDQTYKQGWTKVFEVLEAKFQRVILDGVKDHLIPHLAKKKIAKDMSDTLNQLFEAKNENCEMVLKDKLHNVKMNKDEGVSSYLTHLVEVKDELAAVGEIVPYQNWWG